VATTSRHLKIQDPALSEQLDYYRARASEYDQWWLRQGRYDRGTIDNRRWFDDAGALEAQLAQFKPAGRILEMASGTGIWSEKLLPFATELTLVDGSREMLHLAERRLQSPKVQYTQANLFDWNPGGKFDTVFFSFWLSHVPSAQFTRFWDLVGRCLAPGGRVFFIDSRHEPTSTALDHLLPNAGATQLKRRLNDGREFRIYKIFHDPDALQSRMAGLGWNLQVAATERYFIHGHGSPCT
jgi:demethylmenaquinone methyltransferase/2-methoxy-6-polyprenyl-1,4-benzoquinol methylase